jgi:external thioesterase TEII
MSKPQLFLLHFAGGNCFSFQFMRPYLTEFEFIPLELPGRGKRINERLLTDLDSASKDIFGQIRSLLSGDHFLIYGHSMGAVIALKVAGLLEAMDIFPIQLVVTGNPGPGVKRDKVRSLMQDEEFKKELKEIGGMPEEILSNKEIFDFFEPILRADFEVAEAADNELLPLINAPIYAIMGSGEERTDEIGSWRLFTRSGFESKILQGGHFFIYDHVQTIAATIKNCYQQYVGRGHIRQTFKI